MKYWAGRLLLEGLRDHSGWAPAWRSASLKPSYRYVIVGGGGHGLATAYYLAKVHGVTDVAVIEKGWIGGGNTGRNTTVIRSNYLLPESVALYEFSLKLYENLSRELNYNIMFSQRGIVTLAHTPHDMDNIVRWANAMQLNGIDSEILTRAHLGKLIPSIDLSDRARLPVIGGFVQRRAGTARHDAVAWGYARGASHHGVDIVQNCEVLGFIRDRAGNVKGVSTSQGDVHATAVLISTAGSTSLLAEKVGMTLPLQSYTLQAMVSEPVKPVLDTVVLSPSTGVYVSQSDKGEIVIGGGLDHYVSYAQRGTLPSQLETLAALAEHFPTFRRLRILRQWAGVVDVSPDSSPILGESGVPGLLLNCGWGTGGFKGIPVGGWLMAHHLATGEAHEIAAPFGLSRFETGALIDEAGASGIAH
ncbi:sarcosine oxidase subunit beta family protein [Burkholderia pyrrocinia]|uniref:sarcosine oxidase subunit beta family protein n=1 Tax=Burkholderia pyrrocinia TaxID=60550 RepID=UPI002AB0C331|nr:sarcosine oxidase subunit beta family protein [Burkholderia pyrrocinia]